MTALEIGLGLHHYRAWLPRYARGVVAECWADNGVTLGDTLRAFGTSPPALTISGSMTPTPELYIACDSTAGGTARGQATIKWSVTGSAGPFIQTGVLTAATVNLTSPLHSGTIVLACPTGTYNTDQLWVATAASVRDVSGFGNHATQATASRQPIYRTSAFNGRPTLNFDSAGGRGFTLPAMSIGANSFFAVVQGDALSAFLMQQHDGTNTRGAVFSADFWSTQFIRGGTGTANTTGRDVSTTWMRDSVRKTIAVTFDGTHAGHRVYVNGVDVNAATGAPSSGTPNHDVGSTPVANIVHYIGNLSAFNFGFRGLLSGYVLANRAWTAQQVSRLHQYAVRRFPL